MKLTQEQLRQIINEELGKVMNESEEFNWLWLVATPYEGVQGDTDISQEEAEKEAAYAIDGYYTGGELVAIFNPNGEVVKLGDEYKEEEALKIREEYLFEL